MRKGVSGERRFTDRAICEGTLGEMMEEAVVAIAKSLRRTSIVRGMGRIDELEIPEEILRRAIANALIHREYDKRFDGQAVSVNVFDSRIEVVNPGGLWGKSRNSFADGRSCCRNAILFRLIALTPMPSGSGSPVEGNGSGIPFMVSDSLSRKLRPPTFCPAIDHFKVILHRPSKLSERRGHVVGGEVVVQSLLESQGEISVRELETTNGLSVNQIRNRIRKLFAIGSIEATAPETSHDRKYRIKKA